MLDKDGYNVKTKSGVLKVINGSLTMMKITIKNGLYTLIGRTIAREASLVQNHKLDKIKLWHLRLRHIGQKGLIELQNEGLEKEKLGELPFYKDCVFGKATKVSLKR